MPEEMLDADSEVQWEHAMKPKSKLPFKISSKKDLQHLGKRQKFSFIA